MKVSICMMVKNEEEMLPRCLDSVKWADELIIVDTGSTDKTVEVAESYGAKVYHHPWENNFSTHRNQSIGYATGDWICIIDADEEIISDMGNFKKRLKRIPKYISALVVNVSERREDNDITSWLGIRFFRRDSGVHYKYAVHNKVVFEGATAGTDVEFRHYGYSLNKEKMEKKRQRTESLLLERMKADPDDHAVYYYMTQMRIGQKRYDEAYDFGLKFFDHVPVGPNQFQFYGVMYFFMAWSALHMEDGEKAYAWAKKGLEFYPDDLDLNHLMARIGFQADRKDILEKYGNRYFELLPDFRSTGFSDTDRFASAVKSTDWTNRTIYTADRASEENMKGMMNAA